LTQNKNVRCVAVGNLKEAKNYFYLLQIFQSLKEQPISLDIYGTGGLQTDLQNEIDKNNLRVVLKGHLQDIPAVLPHYDIFIQSSAHEGFGLSVIEAIAARVPVFISRIPVFEEITNGHAHFFHLITQRPPLLLC
jgi:glycosyltransferase involved in cell wall biosynthesis